jgi:type II secretory pathway pseudopilin PulG
MMRKATTGARTRRGATLVETMVAVVIVAITGLAVIFGITFGVRIQQDVRERNAATRIAADTLESTKRAMFMTLQEVTTTGVVIDNRGTPDDASDDVVGEVRLRFEDLAGNPVGTVGTPMPLDRSMVRAFVEVEWRPAGRSTDRIQTVTIASLLAP